MPEHRPVQVLVISTLDFQEDGEVPSIKKDRAVSDLTHMLVKSNVLNNDERNALLAVLTAAMQRVEQKQEGRELDSEVHFVHGTFSISQRIISGEQIQPHTSDPYPPEESKGSTMSSPFQITAYRTGTGELVARYFIGGAPLDTEGNLATDETFAGFLGQWGELPEKPDEQGRLLPKETHVLRTRSGDLFQTICDLERALQDAVLAAATEKAGEPVTLELGA